jgi:hypothetical protein
VAGTYGLSSYTASLNDLMTGISVKPERTALNLTATPNPFETSTKFSFYLPEPDKIAMRAYQMNGKSETVVFSGTLAAGKQEIPWSSGKNNGEIPAGVYLVKAEGSRFSAVTKVVRY